MGPLPDHRPEFSAELHLRPRRHRGGARPGRRRRQHDEISRRPSADRAQPRCETLRRHPAAVRAARSPCPAARGRSRQTRPQGGDDGQGRAHQRPGAPRRQRPLHRRAHPYVSRLRDRARRADGTAVVERPDRRNRPRFDRLVQEHRHRLARDRRRLRQWRQRPALPAAGVGRRRTALCGARAVSEPHLAGDAGLRQPRPRRAPQPALADA